MLPFTKRPGREESSDVVAKEALSPASASRPSSVRNEETQLRESSPDVEDDRTGLHSARSGYPAPLPAAGRPATMPPPSMRAGAGRASPSSIRPGPSSSPSSMRPPPSSGRGAPSLRPPPAPVIAYDGIDEDADDEDGGRTVVKAEASPGRVVRRRATPSQVPSSAPAPATSSSSTSVAPAAVIRKTQDSLRASQRPGMLAPPPADPVEDDFTHAPRSMRRETPSSARGPASNYPPMSYEGPPSHRPPHHGGHDAPRAPRMDMRSDSTQASPSSRRQQHQQDAFDDDEISAPPPRSFAPPPSSSSRGGYSQHSQMPYQQTMDVTGESGSSGYHTGPPPAPAGYDHTQGMSVSVSMGGGQLGHANTLPAHMMNHASAPPMSAPPHSYRGGHDAPPAPLSSHPAAMPAHFRLAQTGVVVPQMDPPALTASNLRSSSRPAISWAMALAAAGVFVGVVAVAITQREPPPDPQAQLAAQPAIPVATQQQPQQPQQQPLQQPGVAPTNALPPGLLPGSPTGAPPPLDPNAGAAAPAPVGSLAFAPVPVPAGGKAPRAAAPKRPPRPASQPKAPAAGDDDDDDTPPKKAPPATAPGKKTPKDPDEETRKALEALQKAQLESSTLK